MNLEDQMVDILGSSMFYAKDNEDHKNSDRKTKSVAYLTKSRMWILRSAKEIPTFVIQNLCSFMFQ